MRQQAFVVSCVLVIAGSSPGLAQQPTGTATLEETINSGESQDFAAAAETGAADAAPRRPAGTVARLTDGVQHPDLDKAWAEYDAAVAKASDCIKAAIAKQFDAATAKGHLDAAEKWQAIAQAYDQDGAFPVEPEARTIVTSGVNATERAKADLGKAYESVVKALTVDKKIAAAKAVRSEWTAVSSRMEKPADRKSHRAAINQPKISSEVEHGATDRDAVYLSDLQERDVVVGAGKFGKNGSLGYTERDGKVRVGGKLFPKAISMHGVPNGLARVTYEVPDGYGQLEAIAAIADTVDGRQKTALTFKVLGDGKRLLWSSKPLYGGGAAEACRVDLRGFERVTLVVECPGDHGWAQSVWCDPRFSATSP